MKKLSILFLLTTSITYAHEGRFYLGLDIGYQEMNILESAHAIDQGIITFQKSERPRKRKNTSYFPTIGYQCDFKNGFLSIEGYYSTVSYLFNAKLDSDCLLEMAKQIRKHTFKKYQTIGGKIKIGHQINSDMGVYYGIGIERSVYTDAFTLLDRRQLVTLHIEKKSLNYSLSHSVGIYKKINNNLTAHLEYMLLKPHSIDHNHILSRDISYQSFIKNINLSSFKVGLTYSF